MGVFNFKRFSVVNERSAMKVNTDGVLLGAAMTILPSDRNFLDVGTGTGTIALMAAQRISDLSVLPSDEHHIYKVDAVDLDEPSIREAAANFQNSPWEITSMLIMRHLMNLHKHIRIPGMTLYFPIRHISRIPC